MRNPRRNANTTVENTGISRDLLSLNVWVCVDKVVSRVGGGYVGIVVHIEDAGDMTGFVRLRMGQQRILGGRVLLLEVYCGTLLQIHAEIVEMDTVTFLFHGDFNDKVKRFHYFRRLIDFYTNIWI